MLCDAVALQIGAEPLLTVAVLCNSTASRPKANPLRAFARYFHAAPSRFDSSQCHCQTMRCRSAPRPCNSLRYLAFPLLRETQPSLAVAVLFNSLLFLCLAYLSPTPPLLFRAHRGDSFRCPAIACHCFSILRLHYAKHLPAAPLQHHASLHFSIALPRYASPREASAVLLVPKQNSAGPMQFLAVRRSTSPLLCFAKLSFSSPLLGEAGLGIAVAMLLKSSRLLHRSSLSFTAPSHCPALH